MEKKTRRVYDDDDSDDVVETLRVVMICHLLVAVDRPPRQAHAIPTYANTGL